MTADDNILPPDLESLDAKLSSLFTGDRPSPRLETDLLRRLRPALATRRLIHPMVWQSAAAVAAMVTIATTGYVGATMMAGQPMVAGQKKGAPRLKDRPQLEQWFASVQEKAKSVIVEDLFSLSPSDGSKKDDKSIRDQVESDNSRSLQLLKSADDYTRLNDTRGRLGELQSGDNKVGKDQAAVRWNAQVAPQYGNDSYGWSFFPGDPKPVNDYGVSAPATDSDSILAPAGHGTLTVSGANTYAGGTVVTNGPAAAGKPVNEHFYGDFDVSGKNDASSPKFRFYVGDTDSDGIADQALLRNAGSNVANGTSGDIHALSYAKVTSDESLSDVPAQQFPGLQTNSSTLAAGNSPQPAATNFGIEPKLGRNFTSTLDAGVVAGRGSHEIQLGLPVIAQIIEAPGATQPAHVIDTRKIVRTGTMDFEVEHFDKSVDTIADVVSKLGGYVSSTDSNKLENGKMQGCVTLRVPPDRLDVLVSALRPLGELKKQAITAQDVTKQYTDLDSQLRAAKTMEERILKIIETGKGEVKDLVEAERELGTWRTKIEQFTGEINYLQSQESLSTLAVNLVEKNIAEPAVIREQETISAGVEVDDVVVSRQKTIDAIGELKGRVTQADLKQLDQGQWTSTITAEVPFESSGPLIDRMKQIGVVARLNSNRQQSSSVPPGTSLAPVKTEKLPSQISISIYNLANVQPRQSITMSLAAADVEKTYHAILENVHKRGGRVLTSELSGADATSEHAQLNFDITSDVAEAMVMDLHAAGEIVDQQTATQADVANTTQAKRGFSLRIIPAASIPPRQSTSMSLAAADVEKTYRAILENVHKLGGRVLTSELSGADPNNQRGQLNFDIPSDVADAVLTDLRAGGEVVDQQTATQADVANTTQAKRGFSLRILPAATLPPKQTTTATIRTPQAEQAALALQAQAQQAGGRVIETGVSRDESGKATAKLIVDVPADKADSVLSSVRNAGELLAFNTSQDARIPSGGFARARFELSYTSVAPIVGNEEGVWPAIRNGLAVSLHVLGWSLSILIVGLCLVAPWAIVLWVVWKLARRKRKPPMNA